jgi:hypothetical protein
MVRLGNIKTVSLAISDRGENCGRWAFEGKIKTPKTTRQDKTRQERVMKEMMRVC